MKMPLKGETKMCIIILLSRTFQWKRLIRYVFNWANEDSGSTSVPGEQVLPPYEELVL